MDNQTIDITSVGKKGIDNILEAIWDNAVGRGKATYYIIGKYKPITTYHSHKNIIHHYTKLEPREDGIDTLILLWHNDSSNVTANKFLFPLNIKQTGQFISDWLDSIDYGEEPDHDGSNKKGWRLFTEEWGHVIGNHYTIIAAQPAWAMYGK